MALNLDADYGAGTKKAPALTVYPVQAGRFNYTQKVEVETSQKGSRDYWIRPIGGVVNQRGPFVFSLDPSVDQYLQIQRARLEMRCRVVRADGSALQPHTDVVAPINLLGSTMFESVEVYLNGHPFSGASSCGASYKSYIETLLSYDTDARNTHLNSQFLHMDSPGKYLLLATSRYKYMEGCIKAIEKGIMRRPNQQNDHLSTDPDPQRQQAMRENDLVEDPKMLLLPKQELYARVSMLPDLGAAGITPEQTATVKRLHRGLAYHQMVDQHIANTRVNNHLDLPVLDWGDPVNVGFDDRCNIVRYSDEFDVFSPIQHDFFKVDNCVGPGNKIDLKLTRHPDSFILNTTQTTKGYKLEIIDLKLHLRSITRSERIPVPRLEVYQMSETQLHKHVIAANSATANFRIHTAGNMPKSVVVALATTMAVDGAYAYNPLFFHHYELESMRLIIDGENYPVDGLQTKFEQRNPMMSRAYHWLFDNTGAAEGTKGNLVSWNGYHGGQFLQAFDLSPDRCNNAHNHKAEPGFINLALTFGKPTTEPLYVLVELVYPKVLINDKDNGQVLTLDITA